MRSFRHWRGRVFDVLVVAVAVAALIEIVLADLPRARLLMPAVVLYTLPLLLRDRWPFAMPVLVIVVQVLVSFLDVPGGARENWGVVAYVLAFWALGAYNPLGAAVAGLGVALAGVVVVTFEDVRVPADEAFSVALVGSLTWLAGVVLRRRSLLADRAEQRAAAFERDHRDTETAVAEERARIAREVHDVVAHSVSVMTVQAGAARMLLTTDPQRAVAPLLAVEEAGRQASARPLATHIECAFPRLGRVSFASPPRARIQRLQRDLAPPGRRRPHSSPRLPRLVTPSRRRDAPGMPTCGSPTDDGTHAGTPAVTQRRDAPPDAHRPKDPHASRSATRRRDQAAHVARRRQRLPPRRPARARHPRRPGRGRRQPCTRRAVPRRGPPTPACVCSGVGPVGHRPIPRRGAAGRRFPLSAHRGMAGSPLTGRELATQVFHGTTPSPASPGYTYPATRPVVTGAPAKTDSTSSRKAHSLASETPPPTAETNEHVALEHLAVLSVTPAGPTEGPTHLPPA